MIYAYVFHASSKKMFLRKSTNLIKLREMLYDDFKRYPYEKEVFIDAFKNDIIWDGRNGGTIVSAKTKNDVNGRFIGTVYRVTGNLGYYGKNSSTRVRKLNMDGTLGEVILYT